MKTVSNIADRIGSLSHERLTLLALGLREKLEQSENSKREPIAVIGLGCRFPGAPNSDAFWHLLCEGRDAISTIPPERFDCDHYYDSSPQAPGKMYTRHAGFIDGFDQFDPQFFGIAPREAVSMDPQQRLLLEVAWEALEDAGQAPSRLEGSPVGVFVGISTYDYLQLICRHGSFGQINPYTGTGCSYSIASGRLSYILGLSGPNFPVDTACSSSLVTVHLACQSLRNHECQLALAGGVNVLMAPDPFIYFCKVRALSPDGTCKTFDAAADGYVRSEGCALVVLKRLSDAQADGDRVLALIRGTAVNHDGRSSGLTVPNGAAQEELLRLALIDAGLQPADIDFVEAHGTGTPLGDPIEVRALGEVLARGRPLDNPLLVGAVKSNLGHLEAAAGVAGLLKVILALQHHEIPANWHLHQTNPYIPWEDYPIEVPTVRRPWPARTGPVRAGVSSFGFSGTNAHVILEETAASLAPPDTPPPSERPLHLLCLSAKQPVALRERAGRVAGLLRAEPAPALADVCFTANAGHAHFSHRLAVLAAQPDKRLELLVSFLRDKVGRVLGANAAKVVVDKPLTEVGLDSLMAVELRNWIEGELRVNLPIVELMQGPTITRLGEVLLVQLTPEDVPGTSAGPATPALPITPVANGRANEAARPNGVGPASVDREVAQGLLGNLDKLSDTEADSLLDSMLAEKEQQQ